LAQLQVARPGLSTIPTGAENIASIATTWYGIFTIAGAGVRSPVVVTDRRWRRNIIQPHGLISLARCVYVVVAALVLTGCNANQAINPSSQPPSQVFAGHYVDYNPYDPISYAQNNTGRGSGGR
jgi:hypothetical protein